MDQDSKSSFDHSRKLLERLSRLSPQARRYHDILSQFSDALEAYEMKRRLVNQTPSGSSYLEQILRPEMDSGVHSPVASSEENTSASISVAPMAEDGNISTQHAVQPGMMAAQPSALEPRLQEQGSLWSQPQLGMLLAPEISDELGLQLPWDDYVSQFTQDVESPATGTRIQWNALDGDLNS